MASSSSSSSLLLLSFFLYILNVFHAQTFDFSDSIVLPVARDASTLQYLTTIYHGSPQFPTKLVVDLSGALTWIDCDSGHVSSSRRLVPQRSIQCSRAIVDRKAKSGLNESKTCGVFLEYGVARSAARGDLVEDRVALRSVDGTITTVDQFLFSCAPSFLVQGLATGARGVLGLGRAPLSLTSQLAASIGHKRNFLMCLSSLNGVIFSQNGYKNSVLDTELSTPLTYTPLTVKKGRGPGGTSQEYIINVRSIKINGRRLSLATSSFNGKLETKLSTVLPYTKMESSIYEIFAKAFVKAAASTVNLTRVDPVAPFELCFGSGGFDGAAVPVIDLVLQSEFVKWRIYGRNSMVQVNKEVMCLGFLDGGYDMGISIVLGGCQLEDNLVEFDFGNSRLGFGYSTSQTSCSDFVKDSNFKESL